MMILAMMPGLIKITPGPMQIGVKKIDLKSACLPSGRLRKNWCLSVGKGSAVGRVSILLAFKVNF
jgi:hypothetical protein